MPCSELCANSAAVEPDENQPIGTSGTDTPSLVDRGAGSTVASSYTTTMPDTSSEKDVPGLRGGLSLPMPDVFPPPPDTPIPTATDFSSAVNRIFSEGEKRFSVSRYEKLLAGSYVRALYLLSSPDFPDPLREILEEGNKQILASIVSASTRERLEKEAPSALSQLLGSQIQKTPVKQSPLAQTPEKTPALRMPRPDIHLPDQRARKAHDNQVKIVDAILGAISRANPLVSLFGLPGDRTDHFSPLIRTLMDQTRYRWGDAAPFVTYQVPSNPRDQIAMKHALCDAILNHIPDTLREDMQRRIEEELPESRSPTIPLLLAFLSDSARTHQVHAIVTLEGIQNLRIIDRMDLLQALAVFVDRYNKKISRYSGLSVIVCSDRDPALLFPPDERDLFPDKKFSVKLLGPIPPEQKPDPRSAPSVGSIQGTGCVQNRDTIFSSGGTREGTSFFFPFGDSPEHHSIQPILSSLTPNSVVPDFTRAAMAVSLTEMLGNPELLHPDIDRISTPRVFLGRMSEVSDILRKHGISLDIISDGMERGKTPLSSAATALFAHAFADSIASLPPSLPDQQIETALCDALRRTNEAVTRIHSEVGGKTSLLAVVRDAHYYYGIGVGQSMAFARNCHTGDVRLISPLPQTDATRSFISSSHTGEAEIRMFSDYFAGNLHTMIHSPLPLDARRAEGEYFFRTNAEPEKEILILMTDGLFSSTMIDKDLLASVDAWMMNKKRILLLNHPHYSPASLNVQLLKQGFSYFLDLILKRHTSLSSSETDIAAFLTSGDLECSDDASVIVRPPLVPPTSDRKP